MLWRRTFETSSFPQQKCLLYEGMLYPCLPSQLLMSACVFWSISAAPDRMVVLFIELFGLQATPYVLCRDKSRSSAPSALRRRCGIKLHNNTTR